MKILPFSIVTLMLSLLLQVGAQQQPAPTAGKQEPSSIQKTEEAKKDKDDVVRISVTLVQVDAVVTDGKGNYVTNLKPEDFELVVDGRPQHITNFSFIETQPASAAETSAAKTEKGAPPLPPSKLRPEQVRRTIALVVDDLGLSFESMVSLRDSLKKFVDEQMQPGDLVAIIRTAAGMGALQQFTSDKRQLYAAIERVRYYPSGRGGISAFAPIERDAFPANRDPVDRIRDANEEFNEFRENVFAVGTLGAINFVVRGLRELPGRKSVILFSDGFQLFRRGQTSVRVLDALNRLTDLANRASVVIYTVDARGLQTLGFTAADDTGGLSSAQLQEKLEDRRSQNFNTQEGLSYLAQQTGGFFVRNTNDINRGIRRVLDDQKGYYLLGYVPDESTFREERGVRKFHKIKVNVKRAGLKIRSRTGFFGIADEDTRPANRTPAQQMLAALVSPFSSGDVHLKLTSLFGHDPDTGSVMRSMLYIDPHDLTFNEEEGGWHNSVLDIVAVTFTDNGRVVDQESRTYTLRVGGDTYRKLMQSGFVYTLIVPVKKAGSYQLRIAVRDAATQRIGSVNQYIEVPDIGKNRLTLSGIVVTGKDPAKANDSSQGSSSQQTAGAQEGAAADDDPQASPAMRRLRRGMMMDYGFVAYNAQLDRATNRPQLESQMILYREGKPVFTGKVKPAETGEQVDWKHILLGGRLQLGTDLEPGEYVLQIIINDKLAKEKYRMASQWIDFEIVK
jgi:VWFA-related protein